VTERFTDRRDAGRRLADGLAGLGLAAPIVLGLPRGGVPVADEVAQRLGAPLDVLVARKLGAPTQPELGFGAVAEGGVLVLDDALRRRLHVSERVLDGIVRGELLELARRVHQYRGTGASLDLEGQDVVVVDDGLATGVTMRAAVEAVRARGPSRTVVAVPVAASDALERLRDGGTEVVCLATPALFVAVGQWYERFDQITDGEVVGLLRAAAARSEADDGRGRP
jgi:putative phosphoribosyl transferase